MKSETQTKDRLLFLDYDGVIDIDPCSFGMKPFDRTCISNINKLCIEFDLKIVVTSSWKNYPDYISRLYVSGLEESVIILGKTKNLGIREEEIKDFIDNYQVFIEKFIILDDARLDEFALYQVRTDFREGFDEKKYKEAVALLEAQTMQAS